MGHFLSTKARTCCHGGHHQWGVNFYETYGPRVSWAAIRTMIKMSKLYNLNNRSIDFVLAYLQAAIKTAIYLHPSAGIIINTDGDDQVLKIKKNLYGIKDAGRNLWKYLS